MNHPRVSILSPVYNGEKYIASTLDTIIGQTFKDWELILMDGASKDRTVSIAREYADRHPNIKIFSAPDEGPYDALIKGLKQAMGDYICIVCISDGYVEARWLELCVNALDEDAELSLVWGIPMDMSEDGTILGPHFVYAHFMSTPEKRSQFFKEMAKRAMRPSSLKRLLKKLNPSSIQMAAQVLTIKEPPQKQEWFRYWLKTGSIFPDGNMCVARNVFTECLMPYHPGSREAGDWMGWFYNFNSRGYLARCIPMPANYGRMSPGRVSDRVIEYDDSNKKRYFDMVAKLRDGISRGRQTVRFRSRNGDAIS